MTTTKKLRDVYCYDIETLKNFICFVFSPIKKDDNSTIEFILHNSIFQLDELVVFLKSNLYLVGYNVLKFDGQILQFILNNYRKWKITVYSKSEIISEIYNFATNTIKATNAGEFPPYPEWKLDIPHLDVFTIWHFDNKAKATSLKWLQFSMNWYDLREMPIEHWSDIKEDQIEDILFYCRNDVLSTKAVYWITRGNTDLKLYKGVDKIQLRKDIMLEAGFKKECLNWNDVKIGDRLNMVNYFKLSGYTKKNQLYDLKNSYKQEHPQQPFTFKDCTPSYINFKTDKFKEFADFVWNQIVSLEKEDDKHKQEYHFEHNGTNYTIARGGIHSEDLPRIIIPSINYILRDCDIGSQYPCALNKRKIHPRHLGPKWSDVIRGNIEKKAYSKKLYKETKDAKHQAVMEGYKLAMNGGGFGKLNEKTSWQEDSFACFQCTIGNEFEILMLIEDLEMTNTEGKGIHVISANTDGIVCLIPKELEETYYKICHEWEEKVGNTELGMLEYTDYIKMVQLGVNDYLALKPHWEEDPDDKIKLKGDFMVDFELHKNKSYRIIPIALREYYSSGKDPETTLREWITKNPINIFDYCRGLRVKSNAWLEERDIISTSTSLFNDIPPDIIEYAKKGEKLQKTIRYYISNKGKKVVKCYDDGRSSEVDAGVWLSTIFNLYKPQNYYDINYTFYLDKIYNIINKIKNGGVKLTKGRRKK